MSAAFTIHLAPAAVAFGIFGPNETTLLAAQDEDAAAVVALVGPRGADGSAASRFEHVQGSSSALWTVNHNFGFWPDITIFSTGGLRVEAEIIHLNLNQANVIFDDPFAGIALCE